MQGKLNFDVVIIGAGPAGAGLACYLAKAGLRVAIFEKAKFPREHVGESLVPSSTRVFRDLDFLPKMEAAKFPHKYGAVWTSPRSDHLFNFGYQGVGYNDKVKGVQLNNASVAFAEREQPGVTQDYTYHVDRGKFDQLLLEHAVELGAEAHEATAVTSVDFSGDNPVVSFQDSTGKTGQVSARLIADASGRQTLLGRQLGLIIKDTVFDQFAVHTWFDNYDRSSVFVDAKFSEYIYVHFLPLTNSWVWQIPITETITSVGVVTQKKNFVGAKSELADFFWKSVASRPELSDGLKKAKQLRPFKAEGDYSYAMKQICGDKYILVGDAGRFVDPIFSTGVSIALNSARLASRDIIAAAAANDFSKPRFADYEATIRRGTNNWYEFIKVYYRLNVLFTAFINDPAYRLDVLRLLQGDVYDEGEPEVLGKMRKIVSIVENDEKHGLHKFLGDLTGDAFKPAY